MNDPEILLAFEPLTMALIGSAIWQGVSGWFGAKSQNKAQEEQYSAARDDAQSARDWQSSERQKDRDFQAQQAALRASGAGGAGAAMAMAKFRAGRVDAAAAADLQRRAPITASVGRLGPTINNLLGAG